MAPYHAKCSWLWQYRPSNRATSRTFMPVMARFNRLPVFFPSPAFIRNRILGCGSRRNRRGCAQDPIVVARHSGFALGYPLATLGPHYVRRLFPPSLDLDSHANRQALGRATIGLERGFKRPVRHRRCRRLPWANNRRRFRLSPRTAEKSMKCQCRVLCGEATTIGNRTQILRTLRLNP